MATTATSTVSDALKRFRAGEAVEAPAEPIADATPKSPIRLGKAKRISFARPNGEAYFARTVPGADHDVDLLQKAVGATVQDNMNVLLYGKPGTGKTALAEAAHPDLIIVECDGDTTVDDLLGMWIQKPDGTYEWVDGPLVIAAEGDGERGFPILFDEVAALEPKVLTGGPYAAMDGRGRFAVKTNPRRGMINIRPGFAVIGSWNPGAPGVRMSEALLSRFAIHMEYTTDYDLAKTMGVNDKFIKIAKNLQTKAENKQCRYVPQMREMLAAKRAADRFGIEFAAANMISSAPEYDRATVADVVSRIVGAPIGPLRSGESAMEAGAE